MENGETKVKGDGDVEGILRRGGWEKWTEKKGGGSNRIEVYSYPVHLKIDIKSIAGTMVKVPDHPTICQFCPMLFAAVSIVK